MTTEPHPWEEMLRPAQRRFLTAEEAREVFSYDPETGVIKWKRRRNNRSFGRTQAGHVTQFGYRHIGLNGKYHYAHRLAWLLMTGAWPEREIDHVNGVRDDNRWANLRAATSSQNNRNCIHPNRSGMAGASFHAATNRWRAQIRVDGERKFLGWFATAEEAHAAYVDAAKLHHREFAKW